MIEEYTYLKIPCNSIVRYFSLRQLKRFTRLDVYHIYDRLINGMGILTGFDESIIDCCKKLGYIFFMLQSSDFKNINKPMILKKYFSYYEKIFFDIATYAYYGRTPIYYKDCIQRRFRHLKKDTTGINYNLLLNHALVYRTLYGLFLGKSTLPVWVAYSKTDYFKAKIRIGLNSNMQENLEDLLEPIFRDWDDKDSVDEVLDVADMLYNQKIANMSIKIPLDSYYTVKKDSEIETKIDESLFHEKIEFVRGINYSNELTHSGFPSNLDKLIDIIRRIAFFNRNISYDNLNTNLLDSDFNNLFAILKYDYNFHFPYEKKVMPESYIKKFKEDWYYFIHNRTLGF